MAREKHIYWSRSASVYSDGKMDANVHLLVGYNRGSLVDLHKMADELRKTFPQATDEEICASMVFESDRVKGFTIITWSGHIAHGEYPGWEQHFGEHIPYRW